MGIFRYGLLLLSVFIISPGAGPLTAQEAGFSTPYLIPQTIFVGDRGRMVVPLGPAFAGAGAFIVEGPKTLPGSEELVIRRLELERRTGGNRLLIDFIAYAPGKVLLPPIELPGTGELQIAGLEITVTSILNPALTVLAEPALPLAVPGTAFLIYCTLILIILIIFLGIGGGLGGRRYFARQWERFRRRRLLNTMEGTLKRFRAETLQKKTGDSVLLARFSGDMRNFLSSFTGTDCRAWTAGEFFGLFPQLSGILRRSDTLRFSGTGVEQGEQLDILEDTRLFLKSLGEVEKLRPPEGRKETIPVRV